jgi:hypothetical protein
VCAACLLQKFESNVLDCGLDFFECWQTLLLDLDVPLRTHEGGEGLITGYVNRKIRVEVGELGLSDVSFGRNGDEVQEFLEDDIFGLIAELEFLEIRRVELLAYIVKKILRTV